jgi:hypothetical protein
VSPNSDRHHGLRRLERGEVGLLRLLAARHVAQIQVLHPRPFHHFFSFAGSISQQIYH